ERSACTLKSSASWAVSTSTGVVFPRSRRVRSTSRPDIPGSRRSRMTRSKLPCVAASSAWAPSATSSAWNPCSVRPRWTYWPTVRSSSTTRIFMAVGAGREAARRAGQEHPEPGAPAGLAVHLDPAAVLRHDAVADRQPQPGAPPRRLGGEERLEDLGQFRPGDADTGVLDLDLHLVGVHGPRQGAHGQRPAVLHGVERVQHDRHEHLDQLLGVGMDRGERLAQLAGHLDPLEPLVVLEQEEGVLDDRADVDRALGLPLGPAEVEQPVHDPLAALHFLVDDAEVLPDARLLVL